MSLYTIVSRRWFATRANTYARPIIRIAGIGLSASVAVMLLATTVTIGFKRSITELMTTFSGHVRIESFHDESPILIDPTLSQALNKLEAIQRWSPYASLMGMIKTEQYNQAVLFKGYDPQGPWTFLETSLTAGRLPRRDSVCETPEIILSESIARSLGIQVGDKVRTFFFDRQRVRPRVFIAVGLFKTGVKDIDQQLLIGDIATVQNLLQWSDQSAEGIELHLHAHISDQQVVRELHRSLPDDLLARSTQHIYPELFDWLELTNVNALIILILMAIVAAINIITIIAVNLMEKSSRLAILMSLGASRKQLQGIMMYFVGRLCLQGIFWGNMIGLGIAFIQWQTHLFKLNPENYYLDHIPIAWDLPALIAVELGSLMVSLGCMWVASLYIYKMRFTRAIHFDQ